MPRSLTGTTLGDAGISGDGSGSGKWTALPGPKSPGRFLLHLPPATAAAIKFLPG